MTHPQPLGDACAASEPNAVLSPGRPLAFFLPDFGGGGAEIVALSLLRAAVATGRAVDLVLAQKTGELLPLVPAEVRIVDLSATRIRATLLPLIQYLRRERPTALHAMMWPNTVIAVIARIMARWDGRLVLSDHTTLSRQYGTTGARATLLASTVRWFYPRADASILVSEAAAADLARLSKLPRHTFDVVYNPLTLPERIPEGNDISWRARPGRRVLAVGKLKAEKGYSALVQAMRSVRDTLDAELIIVGEGDERPALELQIATLGLTDTVTLVGFQLDPWRFYGSADVFVLSSIFEGFGNVLVEALHAGLKVVSTDCPSGPREILAGGRFGALVPPDDVPALGKAILAALHSDGDPVAGRARAMALSGPTAINHHLRLMGIGDE